MNSLALLGAILMGLATLIISIALYIVWIRHCSVRDFIAHRRGRQIMEMARDPKPRLRVCSCCGKDILTAHERPNCLRNPHKLKD